MADGSTEKEACLPTASDATGLRKVVKKVEIHDDIRRKRRSSISDVEKQEDEAVSKRARVGIMNHTNSASSRLDSCLLDPVPSGAVGEAKHTDWSKRTVDSLIGLVRVKDVSCPEGPPLPDEIIPVFEGAILGRNSKRASLSPNQNKVDLGIDNTSAPGVSRRQLIVVHVEANAITVLQSEVVNYVSFSRYLSTSNTMSSIDIIPKNQLLQLFLGDIILFDTREIDRSGEPPLHAFRVVQLRNQLQGGVGTLLSVTSDTVEVEQKALISTSTTTEREISSPDQLNELNKLQLARSTKKLQKLPSCSPLVLLVDGLENEKLLIHSNLDATNHGTYVTFKGVDEQLFPITAKVCATKAEKKSSRAETLRTPQVVASGTACVTYRRTPCPGDRIRVWYENCFDCFGKRRGAQGWFFANVTTVIKGNISIEFDDKTTKTMKYPAKDVQLISAHPLQTVYYADISMPSQQFAYDANPKELFLGDLVFALYQNGALEDKLKGAMFRGRVAFVDNGNKTVDIAYDDGEYECRVPVAKGKIFLAARGSDDASWMQDLKVLTSVSDEQKEGKIVQTGSAGITVRYGGKKAQIFSYSEIVALLMASTKAKAHKVLYWPTHGNDGNDFGSLNHQNLRSHVEFEQCNYGARVEDIIPTRLSFLAFEENVPELLQLVVKHRTLCTYDESQINIDERQEIDGSLSRGFWTALNSKEAFFGAQLLKLTSTSFKEVPSSDFLRNLIALVSFGPMLNKNTPFPDAVKMGLAYDYLKAHMSNPACMTKIVDATLPNYWNDCIRQATNFTYCANGDESRVTTAALRRVGNSLQVSAYCENLFADLLAFQVRGIVCNEQAVEQKEYRSKAIISSMLGNGAGIRQIFKTIARATSHILIWFGHHILDNMSVDPDCVAFHDAKELCHTQSVRLASALGKICTQIALLYSAENESVEILAQDCAKLMQEAFDAEFLEKQFDPSPFFRLPRKGAAAEKLRAKHWERVKFHFVTSLDDNVARELRKRLAVQLGIKHLYDICYGE